MTTTPGDGPEPWIEVSSFRACDQPEQSTALISATNIGTHFKLVDIADIQARQLDDESSSSSP
jgi:hypothetical protein